MVCSKATVHIINLYVPIILLREKQEASRSRSWPHLFVFDYEFIQLWLYTLISASLHSALDPPAILSYVYILSLLL